MTVDPDEYPTRCDCTAEELRELRELFEDDEEGLGEWLHCDWPPTDDAGNAYPIFFTPDDLDSHGRLRDSNYYAYPPFSGNLEPVVDGDRAYCNAPLQSWRDRYPAIRFCGKVPYLKNGESSDGERHTYCTSHKGLSNVKTAEEQMQTGLFVQSVDHLYEKLNPWKKLVGWGTFESLMGESSYEFGEEYEKRTFDFSDQEFLPDDADEDEALTVKCGYPTENVDASLSLYVAAMKTVQMISVQPRIMYEDRENGQGMMESKQIEAAQLTAPPSEHDTSPQQFKTIETWGEHHLNLPLSRLVRDRPKLLERGGIDIDPESESDTVGDDDIVLEIEADVDGVDTEEGGTDPNQFEDYESESAKIARKASEDD